MKVQIQKWGNSLAVRIPKSFAAESNIRQGTTVDVSLQPEGIVLRPVKKEIELEDLLAEVTVENLHGEIDLGRPEGREIW